MAVTRRPSPQTMAVLLALGEPDAEWRYGYDLCRALGLKAGTVYPILIRLADRGLVETAWEEDVPRGRPARHLYRLSSAGVAQRIALGAARSASHPRATAGSVSAPRPAMRTVVA